MDFKIYLEKFQKAADLVDKKLLAEKGLEIAVGTYRESVFLKLYKKSWANQFEDPLTSESRIFFSVWIDASQEEKLFYNIHALKLRKLKGYSIESRKFADAFRKSFRDFGHEWKNVSVKFGPLTLMQGWIKNDPENFQEEVLQLAHKFFEIEHLVDEALEKFKRSV